MTYSEHWRKVGYLPSGEAIYISDKGAWAKEVDHRYLYELKKEDLQTVLPEPNYDSAVGICLKSLRSIKHKLEQLLQTAKGG